MIFFNLKKDTLNIIEVSEIKEINEQSLSCIVKKAMDGEIEGINKVEYYVTQREFLYTYMKEFLLQFNNVIGSVYPDAVLTMTTDNYEPKIYLTSANNTKIEIYL